MQVRCGHIRRLQGQMHMRLRQGERQRERQRESALAWTMTSVSFRGSLSKVRLRISLVPAA